MNDIIPLLYPVGAIVAAIFAYVAYKNQWKIADFF
jgi:hypothetical protein